MATVPKIKIKNVRFTFCHLAEPHSFDESTAAKYQVSILIDKKDKATIQLLKDNYQKAVQAGIEKFGAAFKSKSITPFIRPEGSDKGILIDCDASEKYAGDKDYAGKYMMGVKSTTAPQVLAKETGTRVLTPDEIKEIVYSGCYGMITMNLYPYNTPRAGIAAGLGNVLKTRDGEYLGGRTSAASDFADDLNDIADEMLDDDDI